MFHMKHWLNVLFLIIQHLHTLQMTTECVIRKRISSFVDIGRSVLRLPANIWLHINHMYPNSCSFMWKNNYRDPKSPPAFHPQVLAQFANKCQHKAIANVRFVKVYPITARRQYEVIMKKFHNLLHEVTKANTCGSYIRSETAWQSHE